jgi:hypothetical protein
MHVWESILSKCPKCGSHDSILLKEGLTRSYAQVFALAKKLSLDEEALRDMVQQFSPTGDRSLKSLPQPAFVELVCHLIGAVNADSKQQQREWSRKAMGRKIIAKLCELGYVSAGKPDYSRINEWVREIGTNNPRKVALWRLTYEEMQQVLNQVTARHQKTLVQ